jgi:two-component system, NarL family, invasion response regulator UvrY
MRVLLVDDHAIVREGLKRVLDGMGEGIQIGEASTAARALQLARKADWDCALVDIALPGKTGLELLKELRRERPSLPVLILSMFPEEQYAVRMLRAGASAYLNKESAPEQLVGAIRAVLRGEKYVSPRMATQIAADVSFESTRARHETLSDREFTVLRMMASGMTGKDIAREISLSNKTVSTYRSRILKKLNLKNNAQLVAYAVKNNLVQ